MYNNDFDTGVTSIAGSPLAVRRSTSTAVWQSCERNDRLIDFCNFTIVVVFIAFAWRLFQVQVQYYTRRRYCIYRVFFY